MNNESKKEREQTRAAYIAGRDAIIKQLGKDMSHEDLAGVVLLMAHSVLTVSCQLDVKSSMHNADTFCNRLKILMEESQKNVINGNYVGRLM